MRKLVQSIVAFAFIFSNLSFLGAHCGSHHQNSNRNFWDTLRAGNREYVRSPKFAKQRAPLVHEQNPKAVILSCADSRVTPEYIFTQNLGKLFVVRSAGQVTDDVVIDTIEFSVRRFDPSVIVVMGHTDCGAVEGALGRLRKNGGVIDPENGHLLAVLIPIERAIVASGMDIYAPDALQKATRVNVEYIANQLISESQPIADAVTSGKVTIIGAIYHLKSGKVTEFFRIGEGS